MSKEIQLSRRQFLMAGAAGAGSLILPNMGNASLWSSISFVKEKMGSRKWGQF